MGSKAQMKQKAGQSFFLLFFVAGLIVLADQVSKWIIKGSFDLYEIKTVIPGFFNLTYFHNKGAAFGILANADSSWRSYFFIGVALLALGFVFYAFLQFRNRGVFYVYAFSLIAGGAVGNLIDRIRFGSVVDFLDFYIKQYHWPAFNVADSAIVVGVGLFLLGGFFEKEKE